MKITKYEHACLLIEEAGQKLVIDAGAYSASFKDFENISAVVVTHVHGDHLDVSKLKAIQSTNPDAVFYSTQEVADEVGQAVPIMVVSDGSSEQTGNFKLDFFGTDHAVIHASIPINQNVGVMINNTLYYPGDSFTIPSKPVQTLAAPAGSPWAKIGEEIDFITGIKPKQVFLTHNAHLSEVGNHFRNDKLGETAESVGAQFVSLKPGDSFSV